MLTHYLNQSKTKQKICFQLFIELLWQHGRKDRFIIEGRKDIIIVEGRKVRSIMEGCNLF